MSDSESSADHSDRKGNALRVPTLRGSSNYSSWSRSLITHLMGRGHLAVLEPSPETIQLPIDNDCLAKPVTPIIPSHLVKKNQKAYALIYLSLSNTVQGELSPAASDAFNPNAYLLWKELQKNILRNCLILL